MKREKVTGYKKGNFLSKIFRKTFGGKGAYLEGSVPCPPQQMGEPPVDTEGNPIPNGLPPVEEIVELEGDVCAPIDKEPIPEEEPVMTGDFPADYKK